MGDRDVTVLRILQSPEIGIQLNDELLFGCQIAKFWKITGLRAADQCVNGTTLFTPIFVLSLPEHMEREVN